MNLYAGCLCGKYLILDGADIPYIIEVDDKKTRWELYCNELEVTLIDYGFCDVLFNGNKHCFPYWTTRNPLKFIGFASGEKIK